MFQQQQHLLCALLPQIANSAQRLPLQICCRDQALASVCLNLRLADCWQCSKDSSSPSLLLSQLRSQA
jgi:hypothetical protein